MKKQDSRLSSAQEILFFGYRAFISLPDELLAKQGLARAHHRIIHFVGRNPGLSVSELRSKLGVSTQALHAPLLRLQALGLIGGVFSEQDHRVKRLTLTEAGAVLDSELSASQHKLLTSIFNVCGSEAEVGWQTVMIALANSEARSLPEKYAQSDSC